MQTLKTAAIVILLMTVMYGAYVSMTTPPEPLPPEVGELLVESDEFSVDDGMAGALDAMQIEPGQPEQQSTNANATADGGAAQPASETAPPSGVTRSLSDNTTPDAETTGTAASSDALDGDRLASRAGASLPPTGGESAGVAIGPSDQYPSTGDQFTLPGPDAVASTFDPSSGKSFSELEGDSSASPGTAGKEPSAEDKPAAGQGAEPPAAAPARPNIGLANAIRTADQQYQTDQPQEALATLSLFYDTPNLSDSDRKQLLSRLDPLAREVIYSPEHLLEQPHRVRQNETLMEIAAQYEVPWQLLANINSVEDPITVLPGTDLKVVRGPFRADIDLTQKELTLFLGDLYAGRFPVEVGSDPAPEPGTYTVHDKKSEHTYYDQSGSPVPPDSAENPYGSMWLDLGGQLCLHGSPSPSRPTDRGCISVADDHAADLHGILSSGASVTIRR